MRYVKLPGTQIDVSVIAMGTWVFSGDMTWGEQSEEASAASVRAALEVGINFFDTAPMYGGGLAEQRLGKGLKGIRDKAVVASKIGPDSMEPEAVRASVEKSLGDLGTDRIDLIQIHWPSRTVPLAETWGALERLRDAGKVRAIGISNFGPVDLGEMPAIAKPTTNQLPYSLLTRAIEYQILPACEAAGIGVLCYSPLMWGLLADKYLDADEVPLGRARSRHFSKKRKLTRHGEEGCEEATFEAIGRVRKVAKRVGVTMADLAVAWLLHRPAVTSVIVGVRKPQQARANVAPVGVKLDGATLRELDEATAGVKAALGENPDLWQGGADSRYR